MLRSGLNQTSKLLRGIAIVINNNLSNLNNKKIKKNRFKGS